MEGTHFTSNPIKEKADAQMFMMTVTIHDEYTHYIIGFQPKQRRKMTFKSKGLSFGKEIHSR